MAKKAVQKSVQSVWPIHPANWNRTRLRSVLRSMAGKRILVVGDVGVDRYTVGLVERISPEAPVPIVWVQDEKLKLGLAANVADNVHALGGVPLLAGVVGKDRTAQDFRDLVKKAGILSRHLIVDANRRTVLKERIVSDRQQLLRVDYESVAPMDPEVEDALIHRVTELVRESDAVILEDYAKGLLTRHLAEALFSTAKKFKKKVAVDPNSKTAVDFYRGATVLTPNTREAERLSGVTIRDEKGLVEAGGKILERTEAEHVVITRGKEGMAIFSAGATTVHWIPTYAREVYDVSGAGDTVIAVLALALSAGASIEEAAVLGNLAAGVEVGKRGTATVSPDEIRMAMEFFGAMAVS